MSSGQLLSSQGLESDSVGAPGTTFLVSSGSSLSFKVVVVGDGNVGKTSLLRRFVRGDFVEEYRRTIGAEYMEKDVFLRSDGGNRTAKLLLWDTAGQEMFSPLTTSYYHRSSAAIVCFSTVDRDSFAHVMNWVAQVEQVCGPITIVLCQAKYDLSHAAAVTNEEAGELAESLGLPFFRVSTKDDFNVTQLFEFTAQAVIEVIEEQQQSMCTQGIFTQQPQSGPSYGTNSLLLPSTEAERIEEGRREDMTQRSTTVNLMENKPKKKNKKCCV